MEVDLNRLISYKLDIDFLPLVNLVQTIQGKLSTADGKINSHESQLQTLKKLLDSGSTSNGTDGISPSQFLELSSNLSQLQKDMEEMKQLRLQDSQKIISLEEKLNNINNNKSNTSTSGGSKDSNINELADRINVIDNNVTQLVNTTETINKTVITTTSTANEALKLELYQVKY